MSASTEEYLEALYTLTQGGRTAGTTEISRHLDIAPASVTEMLRKLASRGYVDYSRYQGVTLTPTGFEMAEKMARKHRLLERFLHDMLHIGKARVHSEACAMEHGLSDENMERLYKESDWEELTGRATSGRIPIQGTAVPFVMFDNADDVTTPGGEPLGQRLEGTLNKLWGMVSR